MVEEEKEYVFFFVFKGGLPKLKNKIFSSFLQNNDNKKIFLGAKAPLHLAKVID